jgi:hypothetical protein
MRYHNVVNVLSQRYNEIRLLTEICKSTNINEKWNGHYSRAKL